MKKITFVIAFVCIGLALQAQSIAAGIKAGVNRGSLTTQLSGYNEGPVQTGYTGGIFARAGFLGFFVQPEVMFNQRVGKFEKKDTNFTNSLSYVDLNLLVGYSIGGVVRFNFGPSYGLLVNASQQKEKYDDPTFAKEAFESAVLGFQIGGGIDLARICVDVRYDFNIGNMGKTFWGKDYSTNSNQLQFTVGYKIIKLP